MWAHTQLDLKDKEIVMAHGGLWRYNIRDHLFPCNPYFPPREMLGQLIENSEMLIRGYPSGRDKISNLISDWIKIDPLNIIPVNGSSEAIKIIMKNIVKIITIIIPEFNEYEANISDNQINYFNRSPIDFSLDLDSLLSSINNFVYGSNGFRRPLIPDKISSDSLIEST